MGNLEKKNRVAMFRCITAALHHARLVFTRVARIFSRLSCMKVDVVIKGRQFSRPLTEKEKAFVIHEIERSLKSKRRKVVVSRSSSYDSLADETLSILASTLTSPATSVDAASVSSRTTLSGSESCESVDTSGVSVTSGSASSLAGTPSAESIVSVNTPVCVTPDTTCRSEMSGAVVSGVSGVGRVSGDAANNASSVIGSVSMETVGDSVVGSVSPVSYYRSSTDLRVEDIEDSDDDGFWEYAPKQR